MILTVSSIAAFFIGFVLGYISEGIFKLVNDDDDEEYISITPKGLQTLKDYEEKSLSPRDDA